jgi:insulysin
MFLPRNEKRIFENNILENGTKVIYVEDKMTDKTIVSVSVNIGSLANPKKYQGLAHFLEHMLFLGSKKFPQEDYYEKVVNQFGGSSNAYTDHFETVYYFSAFNDGIKVIMDVFSRFFIDPLFHEDAVKREINAINNEHQKNINDDHWRQYQLYKNIAKIDNAYNTFPTGNIESLKEKDIREKMIEFWKKYYISSNINICIVSNLKIEEQKKLIKDTFGLIPKKSEKKFKLVKPIYDVSNITYQMKPLSDVQYLNYYWEVSNDQEYNCNKLFQVLGDVLAKYNKDSLGNHLKVKGYIETLTYSYNNLEGIFSLSFNLTKLGCKNLDYIDGTLKYALQQIFNSDWYKILKYFSEIYNINFKNMEKLDNLTLANLFSVNMSYYPLNEVYSGPLLIKNFEKDPIEKLKPYFINNKGVCNFKILIINEDIKNPIVDKYYKTEYVLIDNIDSKPIKFTFSINLDNQFLDMKPKIIKNIDCYEPSLVREKTWYGGCSKFNETTIIGSFIFGNGKFFENEKNYLLTVLSINCVNFYLNQELYNIQTLNYNINIISKINFNSLVIEFSCPNDPIKFAQFINMTFNLILNLNIPKEVINSKKETLKEDLKNYSNLNSWEYSTYYYNKISRSNDYLEDKLLKVLETITVDDIIKYSNNLLIDSSITSFFYGNFHQDYLPNIVELNKYYFNPIVNLPQHKYIKEINIKHPNKHEKNNCVSYYFYIGSFIPLIWLHAFIINLILEKKFYNELRTKKQLGYLVSISLSNQSDNYYFIEKIQSDKSCDFIMKEMNSFNSNILTMIKDSNINEFKKSAENHLNEKDTTLNDSYERYFSEIVSRKYLFNRKKIVLQQLSNITLDSLLKFAKKFIIDNTNKTEFLVQGN